MELIWPDGGGSEPSHLVEYPESLADLFLAVCVFHFSGHHGEKLWEVNGSVTWVINDRF